MKDTRKTVIAGNWKMNKNKAETVELLKEMESKISKSDIKVLLCLPYINLPIASETLKSGAIELGAENCHWAAKGAFTGEVSRDMLLSYGIKHSIVGHSERRQYFGETDETVNRRSIACLENGITPIICVGENLEQREEGITKDLIKEQLIKGLASFTDEMILNTIIAYEPIWAIGTGKTATSEQAQEVCGFIRSLLGDMFSEDVADRVSILYGGSMNDANAEELLSMPDIDGGLIGGASLKADSFSTIVNIAKRRL